MGCSKYIFDYLPLGTTGQFFRFEFCIYHYTSLIFLPSFSLNCVLNLLSKCHQKSLDTKKGGNPSKLTPGTSKEKQPEPAPDDEEPEPIFGTSILPQDYGKIVLI